MKKSLPLMLLCLVVHTAVALTAEKRPLKPEDVLNELTVGAPAVSPDGQWVAYSVTRFDASAEKDEGDIFMVAVAGGPPRQITAAPGTEGGYSWSPDSKKLAFSARRENKKNQVYLIDIEGGEARRLTNLDSGASEPAWSPDGKWIAFYSSVGERLTPEQKKTLGDVRYVMHPRFYHLGPGWDDGARKRIFVVPTAGGEPRQLTSGECSDEGDAEMAWRGDSRTIAFVSNRSSEWWNSIDTNLYTVDLASGSISQLTSNPGPDHQPVWSPDGSRLAYRASYEYNYESENYKIHVMPAAGGETQALTKTLDRNVRSLAWAPSGDRIYFTSSDWGNANLRSVALARPEVFQDVTKGTQSISSFVALGDGRLVLRRSTDLLPNELYTLEAGRLNQLTRAASDFWEQFSVQPAEEIRVASADGTRLQGWLIRPVGAQPGKRLPLVLSIHGGPHAMFSPTLRFQYQLLAHHGYAVLFTNPHGSDGYGQAFADSIIKDWHTKPQADLMRFLDKVVEMGVAEPTKLGVTGGSYGGYLTNWLIGHSDRFRAAVSVAGLSNLVSFYGTTDEQFFPEKDMGGVPWVSSQAYLDNSPLLAAPQFKTPTMVIHGANDWRVQPEQGQQLFVALQKVGVPSVYVEFPNEQHGVSGKPHLVVYHRLILEWFDRWLQGKPVSLATYLEPRAHVHPPTPPAPPPRK